MDTARSQGKPWTCHLLLVPQAVTLKYLLNKCCKPCLIWPLLNSQIEPFPAYGPSGVPSPKWLSAVSQIRHAYVSLVVHCRVIVRRGRHVKRRIRLKEFDFCLICTKRAQDTDISNVKDSLAAVFKIFFRRIDSPVIRMQADELCRGFSCSRPFY